MEESSATEASEVKASISAEDALTLVSSSIDIDLAGITVEFFPPDTAHPEVRASPRLLTIDTAKAKAATTASRHEESVSVATDSVESKAERAAAARESTTSQAQAAAAPEWAVCAACLICAILTAIYLYKKL